MDIEVEGVAAATAVIAIKVRYIILLILLKTSLLQLL